MLLLHCKVSLKFSSRSRSRSHSFSPVRSRSFSPVHSFTLYLSSICQKIHRNCHGPKGMNHDRKGTRRNNAIPPHTVNGTLRVIVPNKYSQINFAPFLFVHAAFLFCVVCSLSRSSSMQNENAVRCARFATHFLQQFLNESIDQHDDEFLLFFGFFFLVVNFHFKLNVNIE